MVSKKTVKAVGEYLKGTLFLTTYHPIPLRKFKSWKSFKGYRDDMIKIGKEYNREWEKVAGDFSKHGKYFLKFSRKMENMNRRWEKKLGLSKKKFGAEKLKKVV